MAVLLETSRGDLVVDLFTERCPKACVNFLKLCKLKYYNNCKFHSVQEGFLAQTGDPSGTGRGGDSVYLTLYGSQARFFEDELHTDLKHGKVGVVGMAGAGKDMNASQFYITLGTNLDSLDGKHTIFGEISEGLDTLRAIGGALTDARHKPLQNIRIWHTVALEDPYPDPPGLEQYVPEDSPERAFSQGDETEIQAMVPKDAEDSRTTEAKSRAVVLEMIGDLPEAEAKPPSDMLFVCKLNPVTSEEDLEIIFSRFGKITACDIIRDWKTGDSLNYAFIGFDSDKAAEEAFFKMNNVLIDDRRIKVDFSQSVYHLWKQFRDNKGQAPMPGNKGQAPMPGSAAPRDSGAGPRREAAQQQQQGQKPAASRPDPGNGHASASRPDRRSEMVSEGRHVPYRESDSGRRHGSHREPSRHSDRAGDDRHRRRHHSPARSQRPDVDRRDHRSDRRSSPHDSREKRRRH